MTDVFGILLISVMGPFNFHEELLQTCVANWECFSIITSLHYVLQITIRLNAAMFETSIM